MSVTLVVDTKSVTTERSDSLIKALAPLFKITETPGDQGATTVYTIARRDGAPMVPKDGGNATLAAWSAGLNVLRCE
jgi:hypothetical protein